MEVSLISPYDDIHSFGLRTISACLKKEGHEVQIIFLPRALGSRYDSRILDDLVELCRGRDLIGITLMTNYFDNCIQITDSLRRLKTPIIWGGIHASIRPTECLDYADMVCIGEGEKSIVELAKKIEGGHDYYNVPGIWFKVNGKIIKNNPQPPIQDLDSIPFPDYEYDCHYILHDDAIVKVNLELLNKYTEGIYQTLPSRGCPFNCTYCCNHFLNKLYCTNKVRKRTMANIIEELIIAKRKLPYLKYIRFDDDAFFMYHLSEIESFNKEYKEHIGLPLIILGATPTTLTKEKLSLLVDAGLLWIRMGIQTGSERTKKLYNRNYKNEQVISASKIISEFKHKINIPNYDIILDNPWETEEDLIQTLTLLTKISTPYNLSLFSLTFFPGTALYERAKNEGLINDDLTDVYGKYFKELKNDYINKLFYLINMYAPYGEMIPLNALIDNRMRRLGLCWLLYVVFFINSPKHRYLFLEGLKDFGKGDMHRIIKYLKKPPSHFRG